MRIQILVYDGYDELDVLGSLTVLQRAAARGGSYRPELVRLGGGTVTSMHGLQLHIASRLDAAPPPALLLVPGAHWLTTTAGNAWATAERQRIASAVASVRGGGVVLAGVGTGTLLLASAGLLRGRPAATQVQAHDDPEDAGAEWIDVSVVDAGEIITSHGVTAGVDVALRIVERYGSPAAAQALEQELRYRRPGPAWQGSG